MKYPTILFDAQYFQNGINAHVASEPIQCILHKKSDTQNMINYVTMLSLNLTLCKVTQLIYNYFEIKLLSNPYRIGVKTVPGFSKQIERKTT